MEHGIGGGARRCGLALVALTAAWAVAGAGNEPTIHDIGLSQVERVRLVLVAASVTDRQGRPVLGLEQEDFRLFEEGVPQAIDLFATEESAPIAVAFLLDVSASMGFGGRLALAKRAIERFVNTLDADDRVGLITFAADQVTWSIGFGDDRRAFRERLTAIEPRGKTALYDAIAASPVLVEQEEFGRKGIVLLTDGVDNASENSLLRATWLARRVSVPIYTLSFIPMAEERAAPRIRESLRVLERFSAETGGSLFPVHDAQDLERAAHRIQGEMHHQYVLGFYPPDRPTDGSFRSLRVEAGRHRRVRARRGYYPKP